MSFELLENSSIAIVTPSFNEEARITLWIESVHSAVQALNLKHTKFEIVIVDDGSSDQTSNRVLNHIKGNSSLLIPITLIRLSQNSGHNVALTTGIDRVRDSVDAIITLDADGEHPALLISQLLKAWKKNPCIVHTIRKKNNNLPPLKTFSSQLFYRLIRIFSGLPIASGMADFKLWDTRLLRDYKKPLHRYGPTRLLAVALSPDGPRIEFDQIVIENRTSRFSNKKMIHLAISSFVFFNRFKFKNLALFSSIAVCIFWYLLPGVPLAQVGLNLSAVLTIFSFTVYGFVQSFKNKANLFSVTSEVLLDRSKAPTTTQESFF